MPSYTHISAFEGRRMLKHGLKESQWTHLYYCVLPHQALNPLLFEISAKNPFLGTRRHHFTVFIDISAYEGRRKLGYSLKESQWVHLY